MGKLHEIEGIGKVYASKLRKKGIPTTEALLLQGDTAKKRKELAASTGTSETLILKWVNRADLARVKGIGPQYADLLEAAGVDTIPELAQRKPENLHLKLTEVNAAKKLVRKLPTAKQVGDWVDQAKKMKRVVTY